MSEETCRHWYLDRFHYNDRTDDGYGPDSPRLGDKGDMVIHPHEPVPFTVEVEPVTGLPALHVPETAWTGERWRGLLDVALSSDVELILHEREAGRAVIGDDGVITLDPPYEGVKHVTWEGAALCDMRSHRIIGPTDAFDMEDALIRLGYDLEERQESK